MKTGAVYVLVGFVAVGMEMACVRGQERPGICPKVPQGVFGSCVEMCSGDESCPQRMKCCSNGCGHICMYGVPQVAALRNAVVTGIVIQMNTVSAMGVATSVFQPKDR
ncbi:WAP four-disulfide core domain protein 18-like [Lynx canadensis]|uniref:WAP four-disulfide core domain protein 18-like n=1 Tax=Lynx canadensis TaxID=61383 RepID=UPI0011B0DCCA|nr:WAP four-disulfide core domain protein 18-like [Lynx canadensis]